MFGQILNCFSLDEHRRPRFVAGVPPDYFSAQGQLWGNPVYNWDALRATGYGWCIDRLRALLDHVDVIRLDHFRGFAAAWHVPAGAPTAQSGQWVPGPGATLLEAVQKELGRLPFIAEDLGLITPDVHALRDDFDIPGTRVLQFAFDGRRDNPYLPDNFVHNTVVYTGTHDNATTREWYEDLDEDQRHNVWSYLGRTPGESAEVAPALMRTGMVLRRRSSYRSLTGSSRLRPRQQDECAGPSRRKLEVACYGRRNVSADV